MADHSVRIAEIQDILRSGATTVSTDGTTITFDLESLRRELRSLMAEDDVHQGRRPALARIDLSSAYGP